MDQETKQNWEKIKAHLEKVGSTDNYFYQRAVAICAGNKDPLDPLSETSVS
jgi:hypothetical protein